MNKRGFLGQVTRYAIVSFSGLIINLFFLSFFTSIVHIYYLISEIFAFFVATLNNFVINKIWTFKEKLNDGFGRKWAKFFIIAGAALIVNLFFLWFFTSVLGIYYLASQILASIFTFITNFSGNKFWTFGKKHL